MKKTMMMIAMLAVAVFSGQAYATNFGDGAGFPCSHFGMPDDCAPVASEPLPIPQATPAAPAASAKVENFQPSADIAQYITFQEDYLSYLGGHKKEGKDKLPEILKLQDTIEAYIPKEDNTSSLVILNAKLLGIEANYKLEFPNFAMKSWSLATQAMPYRLLRAIDKRLKVLNHSVTDTSKAEKLLNDAALNRRGGVI